MRHFNIILISKCGAEVWSGVRGSRGIFLVPVVLWRRVVRREWVSVWGEKWGAGEQVSVFGGQNLFVGKWGGF